MTLSSSLKEILPGIPVRVLDDRIAQLQDVVRDATLEIRMLRELRAHAVPVEPTA